MKNFMQIIKANVNTALDKTLNELELYRDKQAVISRTNYRLAYAAADVRTKGKIEAQVLNLCKILFPNLALRSGKQHVVILAPTGCDGLQVQYRGKRLIIRQGELIDVSENNIIRGCKAYSTQELYALGTIVEEAWDELALTLAAV